MWSEVRANDLFIHIDTQLTGDIYGEDDPFIGNDGGTFVTSRCGFFSGLMASLSFRMSSILS